MQCRCVQNIKADSICRPCACVVMQELPTEWRWLSEALFAGLFVSFVLWTFVPLFLPRTFSCVVLWTRLLMVLVGE